MALDERMFEEGEYVTDQKVLLRVTFVRTLGKFPDQRRVVTAEDSDGDSIRTLSEKQMGGYTWVDRSLWSAEKETAGVVG